MGPGNQCFLKVLLMYRLRINDLNHCFSNFNVNAIYLGILSQRQFGFTRSGMSLRLSISNRSLGDINAVDPQITLWFSKMVHSLKMRILSLHLCNHLWSTVPDKYTVWLNVGWMDKLMDGSIFPQTINLLLSISNIRSEVKLNEEEADINQLHKNAPSTWPGLSVDLYWICYLVIIVVAI